MPKILTPAQAESVYTAMTHLNNVGGLIHARLLQDLDKFIHVKEYLTGHVQVFVGDVHGNSGGACEDYRDQSAFKAAYGLY